MPFIHRAEDLCQLGKTCKLFYQMTKKDLFWEPIGHPEWRNYYPNQLSWKEKYSLWLKEYLQAYRYLHSKFRIPQESELYHFYLKLLIIGAPRVGKTSLLMHYLDQKFYPKLEPTYGSELHVKILNFNNRFLQAHVWEIANANLLPTFSLAAGVLAIFDITSLDSFKVTRSLINEVRAKIPASPQIPVILVATKCDLPKNQRQVPLEDITHLCTEFKIDYYETSSITGYQIETVFISLLTKISEYSLQSPLPNYRPSWEVLEKYNIKFGDALLQEEQEKDKAREKVEEGGGCLLQ